MGRLLKILQLGKFYPPDMGGIERVMGDILEGMNERGFVCDVLCSHSKPKFALDITDSKARIYRTKSFGKLARTSITPQMVYFLRKFAKSYDIIHVHLPDPMANLALLLTCLDSQIIILHWHADITKQRYLLHLYKPLQTWLLKRADAIITTSPKYLEQSPFLQAYKHKCKAIPLGISCTPDNVSRPFVQKDTKTLFALGRFVSYKGFEYALSALRFLPSYRLLLGGDGPLEHDLKNLAKTLGVASQVEFLGFVADEELPRFYKSSSIFLLPSITKSEAFGLVQIEAMAHGLPVVSCAIAGSGVDWVNQNGVSGIVVPPKDPKAIADAVLEIAKDYERFSQNARKRFLEHFTKNQMLDSLQNLYLELMKNSIEGGGQITSCGYNTRFLSSSYKACCA